MTEESRVDRILAFLVDHEDPLPGTTADEARAALSIAESDLELEVARSRPSWRRLVDRWVSDLGAEDG